MKNDKSNKLVAGNWKMYKTVKESLQYIEELKPLIETAEAMIYLAVPYTLIQATAESAKGTKIVIGAQNMNDATEGAFTGEIAGSMLKDAGAQFVILGHSERRHLFGEDDAFINRKVLRAEEEGLQPIVCIGETLQQRESGQTERVLQEQIEESLKGVKEEQIRHLILAYEPVWAIGTGRSASVEDIEKVHSFCRDLIAKKWSPEAALAVRILYGGSVKPKTAGEIMNLPHVDGVLVGGASLSSEEFARIVNYQTES